MAHLRSPPSAQPSHDPAVSSGPPGEQGRSHGGRMSQVRRASEARTPPRGAAPSTGPVTADLLTYKRAVYDRLREMLESFELPPGERLVEADLATRLGVSKTPIREAITLLESD